MKKFLSLLLSGVLVVSLAACVPQDNDTPGADESKPGQQQNLTDGGGTEGAGVEDPAGGNGDEGGQIDDGVIGYVDEPVSGGQQTYEIPSDSNGEGSDDIINWVDGGQADGASDGSSDTGEDLGVSKSETIYDQDGNAIGEYIEVPGGLNGAASGDITVSSGAADGGAGVSIG